MTFTILYYYFSKFWSRLFPCEHLHIFDLFSLNRQKLIWNTKQFMIFDVLSTMTQLFYAIYGRGEPQLLLLIARISEKRNEFPNKSVF